MSLSGCGCSPCQAPLISCVPPPVVVNIGSTPDTVQYRLDITAFEGGLPNCLDALPITPFSVSALMEIQVGGAGQPINICQKVASTAAPVPASIIRPPDYNVITNPYQWYVIG